METRHPLGLQTKNLLASQIYAESLAAPRPSARQIEVSGTPIATLASSHSTQRSSPPPAFEHVYP